MANQWLHTTSTSTPHSVASDDSRPLRPPPSTDLLTVSDAHDATLIHQMLTNNQQKKNDVSIITSTRDTRDRDNFCVNCFGRAKIPLQTTILFIYFCAIFFYWFIVTTMQWFLTRILCMILLFIYFLNCCCCRYFGEARILCDSEN